MEDPDRIRRNAQSETGHCNGCDAQKKTQGEQVNPGLFDPTSDLVFMTDEPRHFTDWKEYDNWAEYNEYRSKRIAKKVGTSLPHYWNRSTTQSMTYGWATQSSVPLTRSRNGTFQAPARPTPSTTAESTLATNSEIGDS